MSTNIDWNRRMWAISRLCNDFQRDQEVNEGLNLPKFAARLDEFFRVGGLKPSDVVDWYRKNHNHKPEIFFSSDFEEYQEEQRALEALHFMLQEIADYKRRFITLLQWTERVNLPWGLKEVIADRFLE